jgi:hypothetical protein
MRNVAFSIFQSGRAAVALALVGFFRDLSR